jgi:prophage regulatory protein
MVHVILRLPEVKRRSGLSRTSIYERVATRTFPAPVSLGGRCVGWLEEELNAWVASRVASRDQALRHSPPLRERTQGRTMTDASFAIKQQKGVHPGIEAAKIKRP